jgi:flavin reductase (DIM6/NTAB) family NADH-FMN oxidoreductase RutF
MHKISKSPILYFGTPVVLISTVNENGTYNVAPMSSAFWLGWRCVIGMAASSKTTENLTRTKQCVLNLPSVAEVGAVNRLAMLTGSYPVPEGKRLKGYRFEPNKFEIANLTPQRAVCVAAPRVLECPVQLEAEVVAIHPLAAHDEVQRGKIVSMELKVIKIHLEEHILMDGNPDKIDPDKWRPLLMSFQQFYGLSEQVHISALAQIPEHLYKTSDLENA